MANKYYLPTSVLGKLIIVGNNYDKSIASYNALVQIALSDFPELEASEITCGVCGGRYVKGYPNITFTPPAGADTSEYGSAYSE